MYSVIKVNIDSAIMSLIQVNFSYKTEKLIKFFKNLFQV